MYPFSRFLFLVLALNLSMAGAAFAQQWQAKLFNDNVYVAASVNYPGLGMGFTCHAESHGGGSVIDSMWFEATIARPGSFLIGLSSDLVPSTTFERRDLTLFVGQTGYRLPAIQWNEMVGEWELMLPANDQLFAALGQADRLVLQVGSQQAWELPVGGLGPALSDAYRHCAAGWAANGMSPPPGPAMQPGGVAAQVPQPGGFVLPPQVQADVSRKCEGPATIKPEALQAGDLDGDGQPDVVVNFRDVVCPGHRMNPFCGAANCSIDIYFSSRGYTSPEYMLGTSSALVPHRSGRLALKINGTYGLCGETGCDLPFVWTGTTFDQIP